MDRPNKMELQSADGAQLNLDALYQIAPSCFTEVADPDSGGVKRIVNFDVLRQLLGDNAVEDAPEAYEFNWVGKQAARAEVLKPIKKTLRPVKEDSVDWDNTQNLYIEGDNLEVLKLLQKSYLGKVKMIYIDPPYNTGNDFVYHDDFAMSADEYAEASGSVDELGNKYIKNMDSNGRFHSDWCSMMYSRLMVARSLLKEDGVIFISIDEHEVCNLKNICNEIFSEKNFIGNLVVQTATDNNPGQIKMQHEYILCYCKNKDVQSNWAIKSEKAELIQEKYLHIKKNTSIPSEIQKELRKWIKANKDTLNGVTHYDNVDEKGVFHDGDIANTVFGGYKYDIIHPVTKKVCKMPEKGYRFPLETMQNMLENNEIMFGEDETTLPKPKIRIEEAKDLLRSVIYEDGRSSTKKFEALMSRDIFQNPKSETILSRLISFIVKPGDVILDFFSGSATTAEAMFMSGLKIKNLHFILVQLPENLDESIITATSKAKKTLNNAIAFLDTINKPHTIPEIAKERIRRAGKKIKEESPLTTADLDTGFRVFRLDEGNYEDVKRSPKEFKQDQLDLFLNNIKADRNDLDLLFGCMLDWGVQLSLPMTQEVVDGKAIYTVNDGDLVACFAENVSEDVVKAMAEKMPLRVIFRDSCFAQDADKINIYETFKQKLDCSDQEVVKNIRVI